MPRRAKVVKRELLPDPRYQSVLVTRMVNKIMQRGKKGTAERIMYGALDVVNQRTGRDALDVLEQAMRNATPVIEVKPKPCRRRDLPGAGHDRRRPPLRAGHSLDAGLGPRAERQVDGGEAGRRNAGRGEQHRRDRQAARGYAPHGRREQGLRTLSLLIQSSVVGRSSRQ